jgi:hypothetical protein
VTRACRSIGDFAALVLSAESALRQVAVSLTAAAAIILENDRRVIAFKAFLIFSSIHEASWFESQLNST